MTDNEQIKHNLLLNIKRLEGILERIDNETINKLFESITPEIIKEISEKDDFDFHTSSIIKLLGIKISLKTAQTLVSSELKKILG